MASESLQGCVIDLRNFALKKQNNFIFKQNMWLETGNILKNLTNLIRKRISNIEISSDGTISSYLG